MVSLVLFGDFGFRDFCWMRSMTTRLAHWSQSQLLSQTAQNQLAKCRTGNKMESPKLFDVPHAVSPIRSAQRFKE
jgi:hypothetical protein